MSRSNAREYVLKYLYAKEIHPEGMDDFSSILTEIPTGEHLAFAEAIITSVIAHHEEIDQLIVSHLKKWSLNQINKVDKNILRLSIAEYLFPAEGNKPDSALVINEAVELDKLYSGDNSYRFVNGMLDTIFKEHHG